MELTTTEEGRAVARRPAFALRPHQKTLAAAVVADIRAGKPETLLAACPGFGKTETAIGIISELLKVGHVKRVLVLAHGTTVLRANFGERLRRRRPDLLPFVRVALPQERDNITGRFDLVVVDEAHEFYGVEGGLVDQVIKASRAKQVLLLTGTPSPFIKRGLKAHAYALRDLYAAGWAADMRVILSRSAYDLTDDAWNADGELRSNVRLTRKATEATLNTLIADLREHCDLASSKTIIACRNVAMARQLSWALKRRHRIEHLLSEHEEDPASANIEAFRTGPCPVLVVVRRASLGFDLPTLANFIDLTGSRNPDRIFQMVCRLVRKPEGAAIEKHFVKAMPPVFTGDVLAHFMTGVLMLGDREFFTSWDGGGTGRLPIRVREATGGTRRAGAAASPFLSSGMMVFGDLFERMTKLGFATTRLAQLFGRTCARLDPEVIKAEILALRREKGYWPSPNRSAPLEIRRLASSMGSFLRAGSLLRDEEFFLACARLGYSPRNHGHYNLALIRGGRVRPLWAWADEKRVPHRDFWLSLQDTTRRRDLVPWHKVDDSLLQREAPKVVVQSVGRCNGCRDELVAHGLPPWEPLRCFRCWRPAAEVVEEEFRDLAPSLALTLLSPKSPNTALRLAGKRWSSPLRT